MSNTNEIIKNNICIYLLQEVLVDSILVEAVGQEDNQG